MMDFIIQSAELEGERLMSGFIIVITLPIVDLVLH